MKIKHLLGITTLGFALMTQPALAADDPSIKGDLRVNIQKAMNAFVNQNTFSGQFVVYDALEGKLMRLDLEKMHEGIVKKGDYYVSCADFVDVKGRKIDIDFLVGGAGNHYQALEAIVHSIDDEKRKYHLEN